MPEEIAKRTLRAIEEKVFPGCAIGITWQKKLPELYLFGHLTYERASSVREDTLYDLASVTKSIPVSSLILLYASRGSLAISDLVRAHIPELKNDHAATIEDLLRYRVKGVRMSTLQDLSPREIRAAIFASGFETLPGEESYSNLPAYLLGVIAERAGGAPIHELAKREFFDPLGMSDTTFSPELSDRIAPTEIVEGAEIRGIVHDESARAFAREGLSAGHAGIFSTAPDVLRFLTALLSKKYPSIVEGAQKGLGWQLNQGWFMGRRFGPRTFGKTGFTGTSIVCDLDRGVGLVILSNRTYPTRPEDAASLTSAMNTFRADIASIVLS